LVVVVVVAIMMMVRELLKMVVKLQFENFPPPLPSRFASNPAFPDKQKFPPCVREWANN